VLAGDCPEAGVAGVSDEDICDIATLVNGAWSAAAYALQEVKRERDDGSSDWAAFHVERLRRAEEAEARANALNFRYIAEHREVLKRAFGL